MYSNSFEFQGGKWEVDYAIRLPNADTPEKAIELGQIFLNTEAVLSKPDPFKPRPGYICCEYAHVDDGYNGYVVQANYPPMH